MPWFLPGPILWNYHYFWVFPDQVWCMLWAWSGMAWAGQSPVTVSGKGLQLVNKERHLHDLVDSKVSITVVTNLQVQDGSQNVIFIFNGLSSVKPRFWPATSGVLWYPLLCSLTEKAPDITRKNRMWMYYFCIFRYVSQLLQSAILHILAIWQYQAIVITHCSPNKMVHVLQMAL